MFKKISDEIKKALDNFLEEDAIIFNQKVIPINKNNFEEINGSENKIIVFIDGGQADIISAGNFCLSFIRVFSFSMNGKEKACLEKNEFYLFTKAVWKENQIYYESKIYPLNKKIISEEDLLISSMDNSIKTGAERAPITKVSEMARRLAELSLAASAKADIVVLDGTLEKTFQSEEKYLNCLGEKVCALAKSSSLFTTSGNSPVVLLNKIRSNDNECWSYFIDGKSYVVKLHPKAKHVFRFEGKKELIGSLVENSSDALFLGYPYGLIFADKMARVSNTEKSSLRMNFLLRLENKEIVDYLMTSNAHNILDKIG